jgi:hypothetical protein
VPGGGTDVEEEAIGIEDAGDTGLFTIKKKPDAMTSEAANSPIINPRLKYLIFDNFGLPMTGWRGYDPTSRPSGLSSGLLTFPPQQQT